MNVVLGFLVKNTLSVKLLLSSNANVINHNDFVRLLVSLTECSTPKNNNY